MCESFGAGLRQRREEQQIALSTIAEQTKIKLSLLEGLERDDISRWPAGIFRRAFVRDYARAIGLQPDVVVREFLDRYPDPAEDVTSALGAQVAAEAVSASAGPPTRLRYLVGAAVGSLSRFRSGNGNGNGNGHGRFAEADDAPAAPPASLNLLERIDNVDTSETVEMINTSATVEMSVTSETVEMADAASTVVMVDTSETVEMMYTSETVAMPVPVAASEATAFTPEPFEPDLSAVAELCTKLSRVDETHEMAALLEEMASVIDAVGLMVWLWDPQTAALTPTLPYGYSDEVLAQLPNLPRDARNATAAAFRSAQMCIVSGGDVASDALVVPLMTREGCAGVLAIELRQGGARIESIRALATILAAQMARVVRAVRPAAVGNRRLA
jgi:cytoskeletal protein RodZ